jgi:hypothetical protein
LGKGIERHIGRQNRNARKNLPGKIDIDGEVHVAIGRPVVTRHAVELAATEAAEPDIVAAFANELVEAAVAMEHVMSLDRVGLELVVEVIADCASPGADFDPVIAFAAKRLLGRLAAEHEVVADAAKGFIEQIRTQNDEILARVGDDQINTCARIDRVVSGTGANDVVAEQIGDDVVAVAAEVGVITGAAFEAVIAAVA